MTSIANPVVSIQTSPQSVFSTPEWFGELTVMAHFLTQQRVLAAITERVRFARRRFGRYEVIDFVAVLIGYALSAERTLEAFYARLHLWWLPGTSVRESDGCALDCFMFSELWHSQIKEHKSISRVYLYHAEQTLFIFSFGGS